MFADSSGWACLVDRRQSYHALAAALVQQTHAASRTIVTTNYVLAELTALLTSPLRIPRPRQIPFLTDLRTVSWVHVVAIDSALETLAWQLWASRPDKNWTLVDCAASW